jgi:hypothetical protein
LYPHCTPVSALAFLYGRGGLTLVLGTTATIALGFVFATAVIAVLVNGVEKARAGGGARGVTRRLGRTDELSRCYALT